MNTGYERLIWTVAAAGLLTLAGCGGSGSEPQEQTGFLSLGLSDGPAHDAAKVCIAFDEIELKGQGAPMVIYPGEPGEVVMVDLLEFQGENAMPLLYNEELLAGEYQWLRLGVNAVLGGTGGNGAGPEDDCMGEESYIVTKGGEVRNLYIPSGNQSGLKFVNGLTIPVNSSANYTAEFDLMLSLPDDTGFGPDARLRPTVRLVNNVEVGTLTGLVDNDLAEAEACDPSVYVFNDGITPNAIDDGDMPDEDDPIATAMVNERLNGDGTTSWDYTIGFLLAGDYEAAFTCDGESFEPPEGKPAMIAAQEVETVSFP